jgi:hypothetical protein
MAAEDVNEPRNYVTHREFDHLGDYQLVKNDSAVWNTFKKPKCRMTRAVQSKFFKNFVATVKVLGLYQACDAFLRGSLNSYSVPDICWSRQCVKRTAESATSEKARLNMASQNAATKNINFSFA